MAETPSTLIINIVNGEVGKTTSPLHIACKWNDIEIAEYLLGHGADINCLNFYGKSPLIIATENSNLEIVKLLVKKKADVNIIDQDGNSALFKAIKDDNVDIVQLLCDTDDMIENQKSQGLIKAMTNGKELIAKILTRRGADVNIFCGMKNMTVLMFAVDIPDVEWVKELVSSEKINLNLVDQSGNTALMRLVKKITTIEDKSLPTSNNTDMEKYQKYTELVEFLVNKGSDLLVANNDGSTALHFAAQNVSEIVIKILLDKIISNKNLEPTVKRPKTSNCKTECSPVDVFDKFKRTPLHLAVTKKRMQNVKLLVEAGANVNLKFIE